MGDGATGYRDWVKTEVEILVPTVEVKRETAGGGQWIAGSTWSDRMLALTATETDQLTEPLAVASGC